jgi:hypothetical protein
MITLLIAIVLAIGAHAAIGGGWGIFVGILVFFAIMAIVSRVCAKKLEALVGEVQECIGASQNEMQKMANRFQAKPIGSQKQMQEKLEKVIEGGVMEAITLFKKARPLYKWNLLAERQINTQRFVLNFQIKRFDETDKVMPKILVLEPRVLAMKLARQYATEDAAFEKTFQKGVRRFKGEKGLLLYAIFTFGLVKRKEVERAVEVLAGAKELIESDIIQRNWQALANNNVHLFSWGALGEDWYSLHLEKPPRAKASRGQMKGHPMAGKGKRRYF